MKHWIYRVGAGIIAVLMLVSLCACNNITGTVTTTGADTTTTTAVTDPTGDVTDPTDDVTDPTDDEPDFNEDPTTTEDAADPTDDVTTTTKQEPTAPQGSAVITVVGNATTGDRPWLGATAPVRTTTTTTTEATTEKSYATLPVIERDPTYDNTYGIYHTLLGYTSPDGGAYSKSQWLPSVGYVKDGEVQGVMYDSIIILPSPSVVYGSMSTKHAWDNWRKHTYKNLDTLNEAALEVQEALSLKDYKVKVLLTLVEPSIDHHSNWGTLNGASLGARNDDERLEMVKYMVDSYITEMAEKNYSNLDFVGFYWFDEALDTNKGAWYIQMNDYLKSKGKFAVHAPYYKSRGYNYWKTYGFALNAMQSNYFHESPVGQATCGPIERLYYNQVQLMSGVTSGITVECSNVDNHDCLTAWKWTLWEALKNGVESAYHIYYFGTGANAPYDLSRSSDPYFRSAYDELYKYFNHTITKDELWIEPFDKEQEWLPGANPYM